MELETGVWIAEGYGDPPRTLKKENAAKFNTHKSANTAMIIAQKFRPFLCAKVIDIGENSNLSPIN